MIPSFPSTVDVKFDMVAEAPRPLTLLGELRSRTVEANPADNDAEDIAAVVREADVGLRCGPEFGRSARRAQQPAPSRQAGYGDLGRSRPAHEDNVNCILANGIAMGSGGRRYRPLAEVRRGQMASMMVNTLVALGLDDRLPPDDGDSTDAFSDIAGSLHRTNINRLGRARLVTGIGGGRFGPDETVRRQQMAAFLVRLAEVQAPVRPAVGDHFGDVPRQSVHHDTINAGFEASLFTGTEPPRPGVPRSGRFARGTAVKRDQLASFLVNLSLWLATRSPERG